MNIVKLTEAGSTSEVNRGLMLELVDNCQHQIRSGGSGLYRGISVPTGALISKEAIRNDRLSRSQSFFASNVFNELFNELHHVQNLRHRASFVTSSPRAANSYGALHIAFIPDRAKLVYNPDRSDSIGLLSAVKSTASKYLRDHAAPGVMNEFNDLAMDEDYALNPRLMDDLLTRAFTDPRSKGSIEEFYEVTKDSISTAIQQYQVSAPSAIADVPENGRFGTEVMVIDSPHIYVLDYKAVVKFLQHPNPKDYKSVYNDFLDYLVMELD